MQVLGYRDISLEIRAAEGKMDRLPALAAELAALPLDVIVTDGGPAVVAARRATTTIPIVIGAAAIDLVQQGLVTSLARPGGNVTGFLISTGVELDGKRLELLREALPSADPGGGGLESPQRREPAQAGEPRGLRPGPRRPARVHPGPRRPGHRARARRREPAALDAMLALADAFLWSQRERIVAVAARHRLPAMYAELDSAEAGGRWRTGPRWPTTSAARRAT